MIQEAPKLVSVLFLELLSNEEYNMTGEVPGFKRQRCLRKRFIQFDSLGSFAEHHCDGAKSLQLKITEIKILQPNSPHR